MSIYGDKTAFHCRMMVKEILSEVEKFGLRGEQHFCISFNINCMGVEIPQHIKDRYKAEGKILIVIRQNEYENLSVNNNGFHVDLGFNGVAETVFIPFTSITSFSDPSQNFVLSFEAKYQMESMSYNNLPRFKPSSSDNVILFPARG